MNIESSYRICHDCGAEEGEHHQLNCDMERCPFCGRQLIGCGCCYELLGIDVSEGTWFYEHGLTSEQEQDFLELLEKKGRIPWVMIPVLCALCGEIFPTMFTVKDKEWNKYIVPELQDKVLCYGCYNRQKKLFPSGWRNAGRK